MAALLDVKDLTVRFATPDGEVTAVNGLSFAIERGQTLGIVGESGSGKSQSMLGIMGLLAPNGTASGSVRYDGQSLLDMPLAQLNRVRGNRMAMIFQDPMTALNPYLTVERQMTEVLEIHRGMARREAQAVALRTLDAVKIPDAARRMGQYPHEFSGGMRQRVMIAMALLCEPEVLIADEPTTALDVTVQAQIIELLQGLQRERGTSIVMITHDLGVVAGLCDQVVVMYGGRVMEQGQAGDVFYRSSHPYTRGLLRAMPRVDRDEATLTAIPGLPPNMARLPAGCPFTDRCQLAVARCRDERPALLPPDEPGGLADGGLAHLRACHLPAAEVRAQLEAA